MEGSWFKHPFWKSRFLLEDKRTLDSLLDSDVPSVIIDTSKGRDVMHKGSVATAPAHTPMVPRRPVFGQARRSPITGDRLPSEMVRRAAVMQAGGSGSAREFGTARNVVARASKVISRVFLEARLGKMVVASELGPVIEDIYASVQRNLYAFNGLLRCKQDSEYIYQHSLAVSALMIALARTMRLTPLDTREAGMAGLLMDIGVGQLPADALVKGDYRGLPPDLLNGHVLMGHALLKAAGDIPDQVLRVCLRHHEMLDGSGYPQGLMGDDIDVLSRMAAVCDLYDNLVSGGAGEAGMDPAEAIRAMDAMGPALDREVLRYFVDTVGVYPIGAFVRLRSDRVAMVVDEDPADNAKPTVRVFHSLKTGAAVRASTIVLSQCYGEDEIVGTADPVALGLGDAAALRDRLLRAAEQAAR